MPNRPPSRPAQQLPPTSPPTDPLWLCRLSAIPDGDTRGLRRRGNDDRLIALRQGYEVRVFHNRCPHQDRPLEYRRDRFLAPDGQSFMCYAHAARFRLCDGLCFAGPCEGQALESVAVRVIDGDVWLIELLAD